MQLGTFMRKKLPKPAPMPLRVSHVLAVIDHAFSAFAAVVFLAAILWLLAVTGPLTPAEEQQIEAVYANTLAAIEGSAAELRAEYCADRDCTAGGLNNNA